MTLDLQPVLEGNLVPVRPLQPEDRDALFAVARDPLIWEQHPASDRCQEPVFRAFFQDALDSGGGLAVLDAATGAMIGSSRYHGYDPTLREVEIGWTFLARMFWGGRYNGELKQLMLDHAFRTVRSVVFLVGPDNIRSQRAVEKIGGRREGARPNGHGEESLVYRITASAWAQRTP